MNDILGRPSRPGPEADLVNQFVHTALPPAREGENRSVFIEPYVESSRPDIVVVYWDPSITEEWPEARLSLDRFDLRLAHLLHVSGAHSEQELRLVFPHQLQRSLGRLDAAALVAQVDGLWGLTELTEIYAVHRIISFEAKVSSLSKALQQAYLNMWFASQSYVLTRAKRPRPSTIEQADLLGLGLWVQLEGMSAVELVAAEESDIPQSYASWLFNELAWKAGMGAD